MVVVAIIAIIASIALPSYFTYIVRSKLTEAHNGLADFHVRMEQSFQDNRSYAAAGGGCGVDPQQIESHSYFKFSCAINGTGYTAKAAGVDVAVLGFTYALDQSNNRSTLALPATWGAPPGNCWTVRKGGGCT